MHGTATFEYADLRVLTAESIDLAKLSSERYPVLRFMA